MSALVSIYLLVDFFERIDNFLDAGKPVGMAAKYFLLKIPFMADMLQPVSILLAGVITLGLLNHSHEMMALKAGGIGTLRIAQPLIISAIVCTLFALVLAETLLPATMNETTRIWDEEVHHKIPKGTIRNGRIYHKGNQGIYSFIRPDSTKNTFDNFSYTKLNNKYESELFITAEKAVWNNDKWTFYDGQIKRPVNDAKNIQDIKLFKEISIDLPEGPLDFFAPVLKLSNHSISKLFSESRDQKTRLASVNFHSRLSYLFLGIPLVLMGLPVLLIVYRKWGQDLTVAVPISCGLAFVAWGWWSTSQSLAKAEYLSPFLASWSLYFLICPLGLWLLRKQI